VLELLLLDDGEGVTGDVELVDEWLRACAHAHRRVPPRLIPELLELGTRDRARRNDVHAVVGRRGEWLAALNPRSAWARHAARDFCSVFLHDGVDENGAESAPLDLGTATREERRAILSQLRATDPDGARELVAPVYPSLPAEQRAEVIDLLAINL